MPNNGKHFGSNKSKNMLPPMSVSTRPDERNYGSVNCAIYSLGASQFRKEFGQVVNSPTIFGNTWQNIETVLLWT